MEKYQSELTANELMRQFDSNEGLHSASTEDLSFMDAPPVALSDGDLQRFMAQGYLALQPTTPRRIHQRIFDTFATVMGPDSPGLNPGNNMLPMIPELRLVFDDPVIRGALASLLGEDYLLHPHRALHNNPPGSGEQAWHHDTYWGYKRKVRDHRPWWVLLMYMPQDTSLAMGPTGVLPGSQHLMKRFAGATAHEVGNAGPAGVCMLLHYDIWHRKLENTTDRTRFMTKFEFVRMSWPAPRPDAAPWQSPATPAVVPMEPVWRRNWAWLTGDDRPATDGAAASADDLAAALADPDEGVALNAAYELAALGRPGIDRLGAAMAAADGDNAIDPRIYFDEGQEAELGYVVRHAAYGLAAAGADAVATLVARLAEGGELGRKHAAYALGQINDAHDAVVPALIAAVGDEHADVRIAAVEALGLKPARAEIVTALVGALRDADDEVRFNAALALARVASGDPATAEAAVPALGAALDDPNRYVRGYAVEALDRIGSRAALRAMIPALKDARWCPMTTPESTF